ncbi:hypothetical protein NESM_000921800 [Novymonas esmeraldas]|uniref:Uncharacterized protein n=1 Tax=Novymonas esmeraldas TaxID=1808958 RepID=A0AAW0F145_9TRYP
MSRVLCHLLLVAAVAAAVLVCTARAECDTQCKTCELGVCVGCNSGYRLDGQTCIACSTENCRECSAFGWCTLCEDGYRLSYSIDENSPIASPILKSTCRRTKEQKCPDTHCKSCVGGRCVACEDGYYLNRQTCIACLTENCRQCSDYGLCIWCEDGYRESYSIEVNETTGKPFLKGTCKSTA